MSRRKRIVRKRTFIALLLLLLFLLLALDYINQQSKIIDALVKNNNEKYTEIEGLAKKVKVLQYKNKSLENAVLYEHGKLQTIKIPKQVEYNIVENKTENKDSASIYSPPDFTTVIIGTFVTFGATLRTLMPMAVR